MNLIESREFLKIQLRFDLKEHVDQMNDELCIELARQIFKYQDRHLKMFPDFSMKEADETAK